MEGTAALVPPGAGDGGDRGGRVHVHGAVALARESVAETEIGPLRFADEAGKGLDLPGGKPGDRRCPFGRTGLQMRFQAGRVVRVTVEIVAVGEAVAEQDVHDRAGERAVGPGPAESA